MLDLIPLISDLAAKYPVIATIFMVIGFLRVIFKPIFAFAKAIAEATSWTDKDNQIIEKAEKSKVYSTISFVLDFFASIKLPEKK